MLRQYNYFNHKIDNRLNFRLSWNSDVNRKPAYADGGRLRLCCMNQIFESFVRALDI